MKRKVLIITYYWPPSGGSGVQRWVKFTKYLPEFGWEPVIYTPENPEVPATDQSLEKEIPDDITVLKTPIWEPYALYKKITGKKRVGVGFMSEEKKSSFLEAIFKWIRGNFFIPDARKFWIKPSIRYLTGYLESNTVDALITTGPPHSLHLIGLEISNRHHIPWLADFRDPWTNIDFYEELMLTAWADRKHHKLEKRVLTGADRVTVVSPTMQKEMEAISRRPIDLLTNGYDSEDYREDVRELDPKFSITHIGTMVETRNPHNLWKVLSELVTKKPEFANDLEIQLVGKVDISILESIERYGLRPYLTKSDYLPHEEVTQVQQKSRILLLVLNDSPNAKCLLPGKLFEYLAAKRPIITIGPSDGDVARIMKLSDSYLLADLDETGNLKSFILHQYRQFKQGMDQKVTAEIEQFSRASLTEQLSAILNELTS